MTVSRQSAYTYIDDAGALERWCDDHRRAARLAVDTEFERQRTYYPELCLLQVAAAGEVACIDPLTGLDCAALFDLLANPGQTCLIHAARQDLEVFEVVGTRLTGPLIDTQIAAGLCGFGEQVGYAELVQVLLEIALDKSQTRTNWKQRPLTDRQLDYAADDVRYLEPVAEQLCERLATLGRLAWLEEDCAALLAEPVEQPPETAWTRVKGLSAVRADAFARGIALATWREREARSRDLPRGWVLKDQDLMAIALAAPKTPGALAAAVPDNAALVRRHGARLIEVMGEPVADQAALLQRAAPLEAEQRKEVKRLSERVRAIAASLEIGPSVLLTRREMEQIISGSLPSRVASGWRAGVLDELVTPYMKSA